MKAAVVWRREFAAYLAGPAGWVLLAVFLLLSGHFFYTDVVYFSLFAASAPAATLWQLVFLDMRYVALLAVPPVTMRLFAQEMKLGTIELLRSCPLSDRALVSGKFLAAWTFFLLLLAPTALAPALLFRFHAFDPAPVFAAYLGLALLGAACVSLGMFVSSLTESQTAAAMATFGVLVLLWFLTWNEAALAESSLRPLAAVSLFDRFLDFSRGVIDTRHVVFFASFTVLFCFLTRVVLTARWSYGTAPLRGLGFPVALGFFSFVVVQGIADRHAPRFDLSAGRVFSLSPATEAILAGLPRDVQATVFHDGADSARRRELTELLDRFASASARFRYRLLDLDRSPAAAARYGVSAYDTGVLEAGDSRTALPAPGEAEIAAALLRVLGRAPGRVCFLAGEGARDPRDRTGRAGYGRIAAALEAAGATLAAVDRLSPGADCRVAVLPGTHELPAAQAAALSAHLREGGNVLLLLDPPVSDTLRGFLRGFGIAAEGAIVDERNRAVAAEGYVVRVPNFDRDVFRSRVSDAAELALAAAVRPAAIPAGVRVRVLALTGENAWSLAGDEPPPEEPPTFREGVDRGGPVPVAALAELGAGSAAAPGGTLIVVGDSDFAANAHLDRGANADVFTAAVLALADAPEVAAVRAGRTEPQPYRLTLGAAEARTLFWTVEVGLPGTFALAGILAAMRRRRRQGGP